MSRARHAIPLLLVIGLVASMGCKKPKKFMRTKHQQELVDNAVLSSAPSPAHPIGANLGDKIKLIGMDVEPKKIRPGGKVKLTFYWEVLEEIGGDGDWMIFVHLEGPVKGGGVGRVNGDHYAVEDGEGGAGLYPPKEWKKGQIIKDTKTLTLKATVRKELKDVGPGQVVVYTGIFDMHAYRTKQADVRLEVKNTSQVKVNGGRVEAARFMVGQGKPPKARRPFRAPELQVRKAISPISIDGKLDEPAWRAAVTTGAFKRPDGAALSASMLTQSKVLWDDTGLYIGFLVHDKKLHSPFTARDQELWKADVVEVYLDPGNDGKNYIELQVSPNNVVFDALFKSHRKPHHTVARKWNMPGIQTAVSKGPLPGRATQPRTGWTVEIKIPWTDMAAAGGAKPALKTKWRANFFRIEHPKGISRMASWSSVSDDTSPDFHNLNRAGHLVFVETPAAIRAKVLKPRQPTKLAPPRVPNRARTPPLATPPSARRPTARVPGTPPPTSVVPPAPPVKAPVAPKPAVKAPTPPVKAPTPPPAPAPAK